MAILCALTERGICSADGREVGFDLLAGSLKLLAQEAILRRHVSTDPAEIAESQFVLYASLLILQSVAFDAHGVRLPLATRQTAQGAFAQVSDVRKTLEGAANVSPDT